MQRFNYVVERKSSGQMRVGSVIAESMREVAEELVGSGVMWVGDDEDGKVFEGSHSGEVVRVSRANNAARG